MRTPPHTISSTTPPSITNSQFPHKTIARIFRFSMHHPSPPHNNQKKITDPTTSEQPEAKAVEVETATRFLAISKQESVIREMSTLIPEGGQEANPYPRPCCHGERMDSVTGHGTKGRNRRGGRSHDSSPESTKDRHDMPVRVQVMEEDTSEDEQGDPYRSRARDDTLENGRERLKRHRREVAGRVWIPEIWGQEELLKDWVDCTVFDSSLVRSKIMSAKAALVEEGRRASSPAFPIENRC